ncbi:WD40 repeat domain-containing protein [Stieleria varia]|uniref:WD domain, G-beta repeat n=1 Tax=Stieleria varia TaxID=2528005 RepID=A0A5C6B9C4_9BACT|nr:WD40 repeat domain-containing protein [Stieleria varia]TWU08242.1 WD domain, G-beta repeat [Stieleria varia]
MICWRRKVSCLAILTFGLATPFVPGVCQDANAPRLDFAGDPLPPAALLRMGSKRFTSPDGVMEFFLTDDEKTLVSIGQWIIGWEVATGKELWRKSNPTGYLPACYGNRPVTGLPDGKGFLLADGQAMLSRWDARSGESTTTKIPYPTGNRQGGRLGRDSSSRAVDVSPEGKKVFVGNGSGFTVYDLDGNEQYGRKQDPEPPDFQGGDRLMFGGAFAYGRFSPVGNLLATVLSNKRKTIELLDADSGEQSATISCKENPVRMEFSPDGKRLAVTERDTSIRLYDVTTGELVWDHAFDVDKRSENYTSALAFTPDGKRLAICERNQTVFVMEVESGTEIGAIRDHSWNPWALQFMKDNDTLFSSGWGGTIHQWSLETLQPIPLPSGFRGTSVATLSPDGIHAACVDQQGAIRLFSLAENRESDLLRVDGGVFESIEFSHSGTHLAAGGPWGGNLHLLVWNLADRRIESQWEWPLGKDPVTGVEEIRFSQDDSKIALAVFRQSSGYLIDRETGNRTALPHPSIYGLSFGADGESLVTAGWDKKLRRWHLGNGEMTEETLMPDIEPNDDTRMYTVCCDPLGGKVATAQMNAEIRLWHEDDFSLIRRWDTGASFSFGSMRYSPDGLWLASGDASGRVLIWDPATGTKLHELTGHEDSVYVVGFGKDNRVLCSGGANLAYVWNLRPGASDISSVDEACDALIDGEPDRQYAAWWYLVDHGDAATDRLSKRAAEIKRVYDIDSQVQNSAPDQRARREVMLRQAAQKSESVVTLATVRRIVSVLSHIDSKDSIAVLTRWSQSDDELGRHAAWEIRRRKLD